MPILYGSRIALAALSSEEIGVAEVITNNVDLGFLSVFLNILEVGVSILTGGTGAVVAGLVNAAAQTGVDYAETGKVNPGSIGLYLGSALLPGAASAAKNLLKASNIAAKAGNTAIDAAAHSFDSLQNLVKTSSESIGNAMYATAASNAVNALGIGGKALQMTKADQKILQNLLNIYGKDMIVNATHGIAYNSAASISGVIGATSRGALQTGVDIDRGILRDIQNATGMFKSEIRALKGLIKDGVITNLKLYRQILEKAFKRTGNNLLGAAIVGTKSQKVIKLLSRTEARAARISRLSSKSMSWATKVGGYITSPASLAADAISKTAGKLTSKVEELGEAFAEKVTQWVKAGKKGIDAAEDEFVRTGGTLFKSSWIMGYKVLAEDELGASILVQFKNSHPNIITKLSIGKLTTFIEAPSKGRWYINNLARGRGGRTLSELGIEGKLENYLGMLPIAKINEIIGFASFSKSFVTQIRANKGTMIWQTGKYIEGFKQGVIQGIISEGIKSAVALGTRNQYAKQALEGGFGAVASGTSFGVAFSTSFSGATKSMNDTIFEDTTRTGNIVKQIKPVTGGVSSLKGIF